MEHLHPSFPDNFSDRAIDMGSFLLDPTTGALKRLSDSKKFCLPPNIVSLLRILDRNNWIKTPNIALEYEQAENLNMAMIIATSEDGRNSEKKGIRVNKILEKMDKLYINNAALYISEDNIRTKISNLRKIIGFNAIETKRGSGCRLKRE